MTIDKLARFREGVPPSSKKIEWTLKPLTPRYGGTILAVDQSLNKAGWGFIEPDGNVLDQGVVKGETDLMGHAGTLEKGTEQYCRYIGLIQVFKPSLIAHEMPPAGGKMARPESSLVSANSLRNAANHCGVPVKMFSAQTAKKRFTGDGNAEKRLVRQALQRLDPTLAGRRPMNEDIYDAIALGWLALEEER